MTRALVLAALLAGCAGQLAPETHIEQHVATFTGSHGMWRPSSKCTSGALLRATCEVVDGPGSVTVDWDGTCEIVPPATVRMILTCEGAF